MHMPFSLFRLWRLESNFVTPPITPEYIGNKQLIDINVII